MAGTLEDFKLNGEDRIVCMAAYNYPDLTEGKVYEVLEYSEGILIDRPFVTVIGDNGKPVSAHTSRFRPAGPGE